ncbi:MAG TPA: hypothetical protein VJY15_05905 [Candidatus Acidoferrum sp.]|nr:hypothetical protein [Candidatus Acidoferrum sp.]
MKTRRTFLGGMLFAGAATGLARSLSLSQAPNIPPKPPSAQEPEAENPSLPSPEKQMLEANNKDIHKKVEQLYRLATELKAEVDKTDSTKVLSLNLVKKAEEIEKLAHEIKTRSKG